jgi:hypothetical protein
MAIAEIVSRLKPDSWREEVGFSSEVELANQQLFRPDATLAEMEDIINGWLQKRQPCLFGKIAAKRGLISYCILTDSDLNGSDESIAQKIETAHRQWSREGFQGRKSAFVLLAVSKRIADAEPNSDVLELAKALGSLLLLTDVQPDRIYVDEILLELPTPAKQTWRWDVGVNYFSANGDKRWWNDHRIPGGMGFSTNSVGHMVRSEKLGNILQDLEEIMGVLAEGWRTSSVDSLEKALELAMRTIYNASETVSGKATTLLPMPSDPNELVVPQCPVELPDDLAQKNFCEYIGHYHTDYTIPSEYFLPDVARLEGSTIHGLDFTYLFHRSINNPDYIRMGEGRRIRTDIGDSDETTILVDRAAKRHKGEGELINLSEDVLRARGLID